jgi:hypothetical protein
MRERVSEIARATDTAFAAHAIALCDATSRNARGSSTPRALYDACLARLALSKRFAAGAALLAGGGANDPKKAGDPAARGVPGAVSGSVRTAANPAAAAAAPSPATPLAPPARASLAEGAPAAAPRVLPTAVAATHGSAPTAAAATPASGPSATEPPQATDLAGLRARLDELATRSPKDRALVEQFAVVEFTPAAGSARIEIDGEHSGGRYLASNPEPIRTLVARAAGRPLRLAIELREPKERARPAEARISADDPSVRGDPLVRRAAELFDATIVAVTPRLALDESAEPSPAGGDAEDTGAVDLASPGALELPPELDV